MNKVALFFFSCILIANCKSTVTTEDDGGAEEVVAGDLMISGNLANGEDADNTEVLSGQDVDVMRSDGARVGTAESDEDGNFKIEVAAGALETDGFGLTDEEESAGNSDFKFYLQTAVPDDGEGKALGIRKLLDLSEGGVSKKDGDTSVFDTGENSLKEISAITGTIAFENETVTPSGVDVYIPGKSFFARTGDDGTFQLLFVPEGAYSVRIQKGVYIKDLDVTVKSGKTSALDEVSVGLLERDPLPLANVIEGRWTETCYFKGSAGSGSAESPTTGVLTFKAPVDGVIDNEDAGDASSFFVESGFSCLVDNVTAAPSLTLALIVPTDEVIIRKFSSAGTIYGFNHITLYTNNRIVMQLALDTGTANTGRAVTVLERIQD